MKTLLDKVNLKLNAQGGFLKAVSVLVGGTVFAQCLAILALPILTRLYSPKEFALFSVYTSLLMTLSVISCLRFEIAIPIPHDDEEAVNLVALAFISNLIITILIFLIILLFHSEFITLLKQPDFKNLIWLVPTGVFFLGVYNIFQYWATREKKFTVVAKTRMIQSISSLAVQILMGVFFLGKGGLIFGQIVKLCAGTWGLLVNFFKNPKQLFTRITFNSLEKTFKKNKNFPKYSSLEALANSAGIQLPIILIASLVGGAEAGFLMLAMQIMAVPIAFIGNAVSQVYLADAAKKLKIGELKKYTYECVKQLLKIGVLPLIIICLSGPFIFPVVFGEKWIRAGEMVVWMLPWFAMQLLVSPISMSLHIMGVQKIALILQFIGLLIRLGGLWVLSLFSSKFLFEYYAISGFIFYLIYFFVVILIISLSEKN
ncbi:lipopolysaccharide biosynthesis protein [Acinetobacter sp. ANC 3791]|uniref:lipopolysaccharide biosynthesis protein n=1 Tax=Acinetobacter sp. ANC 3791 TaxID=2529836 RepID=UPI00103FFA26|nr:oligosaccharide flippase family protein [Acinetobacter sp. ANC 3791]TCB81319.1 translocase [Acinetobacter sp. ANC 3791]